MSNDVPVISFFDENAESDGADFFLSLSSSNEAQNSKPLKESVDNLFVAQDNNTQLQNGSPPTTPKEVPVTAPEPTPIVQEAPTSIESVYEQKQPASPDTNQRQTTSTAPKPTAKKPETPPPISIFDSDDDSPGASSFFDSLSQSAIQSMAATPKSEPSYVQPLTQSFNSMTVQETPQPQPQTQPVQSNIRVSGTHQTPFTPYQPPSVSGHHYSSIPAPVTPFPATTHFATPSSVPAPSIPRPSMPNVFTPSMPSNMPAPTTFSTFVPTAYPNPVPAAVPFVPTPQPAPMPSFTPFTPSLTPQPTSMPNVFTPTPAVPSVSAPKYVAPPQSIPLPSVAPVSKPPTLPPVVPTMPTVPMAMPNVFTPSPVPSVPAPMHSSMPTPSVPQTIPSIPPQMASPFSASPVNTPPFTPPTMPKTYVPPTIPAPAPLHHSMPAPSIPAHRHSNSLSNVTFPRPQSVVAMEEIQAHTLPAIQQIQTDAQMNRSHSLPQLHGATFAPFPQNPLSMSQSFVPTASFGDATQTGNYLDSLRKPRPVVCFGFGGRLAVMMPQKHGAVAAPTSTPFNVLQPSDASLTIVKILSLSKLLQHTPYMKNLLSFSGPLHGMSQDKVLKMLSERIENEEKNVTSIYDFDNVLLLKLLRVICQHHGMFAPSQADSKDALAAIKNMLSEGTTAHTVNPLIPSKPQEEIEGIMELQALVLAGRVEDAYKYAMGRQLWNHALILSSSLGPEAFKNTVSNYAQTNLMEGAPLRTLYLRLYGKTQDIFQPSMPSLSLSSNTITPAAGLLEYWRENLVALLGNAQSKPIIGSLGDRLWSQQRRVSAAHICYLLAEHEIDSFDNPNSRVVLLGADHKTSVRTFVTAEAFQRTELLEYAKSLGNSQFSMPSLDVFRLVYAYFLAEVGLLDVAKKYHQQVETNMHKNKSFQYNPHVKYLLLDLQNRLHIAQNKKGAAPGGSWITLPSFGSLFNKGISKLIGTEDDQGGAQGYPPAAHHHQPMPQQGHARTYSSGNVVSPMAFPAAQPMPQQAHPPANQSPQASPRKKEEDDLGLGNNSFSTPKKKDSTDDTTSTSKDGTQAQSSISSRLSGFFSPLFRRGTPVADLGQENQFEYNKELGMWLKKGEQPDPAALARRGAPAPPPTMAYTPPPPTTMSGPPSDGSTPPGGSPMPQGPPAFSNAARGGRRQRYVDTLNPDAPAQRAAVPPSQPPGMPGLTPMTPMAPMSTMTPMVPAVFTPQGSSESTYEAPTYSYPPPEPTENGPPS